MSSLRAQTDNCMPKISPVAVLGVAGILGQEVWKPSVFWYNAGLPENIPDLYFGGPSGKVKCENATISLQDSKAALGTQVSLLSCRELSNCMALNTVKERMRDFPQVNLGGLLAWEFLLFHWVEVRRWQDIQNHHCVDEDPIFKGNKVTLTTTGCARS